MRESAPSGPPRTQDLVVVKLGGSIITRKRQEARLRPKILRRLAQEIAKADWPKITVIHGAGSFGHPGASKFGLATPPQDSSREARRRRQHGASVVAHEVRRLHAAVVRALVDEGVPAFSLPPASGARNRAGRLVAWDAAPFRNCLESEGTPVTFGDVVPDEEWGYSILSGDTIATELTRELRPARVLFVSDVPGLIDPASTGRPRIFPTLDPSLLEHASPSQSRFDVTGGIRAKVEALLAIAGLGADAALISGLTDGALSRAIRGERVYGSWAEAASP